METRDLYEVLGVPKGASRDEIRHAYRRLARKHHPDANRDDQNAEERFKEIQHAYEVLSNPEKRREYDQGPRAFFNNTAGSSRSARSETDFSGFSDLFGSFGDLFNAGSGTAARNRRPARGTDATVSVSLRFKDALNGVTTKISAPVEEVCEGCRGIGASPGTSPSLCPACSGRGVRSRDEGFFALSEPCGRCGGEGTVIEHPCGRCGGVGRLNTSRRVTVKVPAGARDGMRIRVPGRGSAGKKGGPPGDLFVVTRVAEHPVFRRSGDDFMVEAPVSFVEAALGAEVEVPKPGGGTVKLKLPPGTQDGKRFKVRGAGAPRPRAGGDGGDPAATGDLVVRVALVVPRKLGKREKEILLALADERDEDVREGLLRAAREAEGL